MKNILKEQRGSILPMFAVVVTLVIMLAAVAVDFARYALASEKLQTAGDSAATAAAMSAKRYVKLLINPGEELSICCGDDGCSTCCIGCGGPFEVIGREDDLLDSEGYKRYCCGCGCPTPELLDRWVEYENNGAEARAAAQMFFDLNKPREMDSAAGGDSYISSLRLTNDRSDPVYPSVVVKTQGKMKTVMMNFMDRMYPDTNLSELGASRCSQGGSFYYDLNGKWHRAAAEGCN